MIDNVGRDHLLDTSVLVIVEFLCLFVGFGFCYLDMGTRAADSFMGLSAILFFGALAAGTSLYWRFKRHRLDRHPAFALGLLLPSSLLLISAVSAFSS